MERKAFSGFSIIYLSNVYFSPINRNLLFHMNIGFRVLRFPYLISIIENHFFWVDSVLSIKGRIIVLRIK